MGIILETSHGAVLDTVTYLMCPADIIQRVEIFHDIQRLSNNSRAISGYTQSEDCESWWLGTDEHTITLTRDNHHYKLELFTMEVDEVNAVDIEPEFVLTRGFDDSCWTLESNIVPIDQDWESEFRHLTDVLYMNGNKLFELCFDMMFYYGGDVPDDFTAESICMIVDLHESK